MHSSGEFINPTISTGELRQYVAQDTSIWQQLTRLDRALTQLMARYSVTLLRLSVGIVFIWFGALKLVPGLSPAEPLIRGSITFLSMDWFLPFLAVWEMAIGLGFIIGRFPRVTLLLLLLQMGGAMSPIILRPDLIFATFPYALTLEGQYVIKDIILISAGLVVAAAARGGLVRATQSKTNR
ncbi:MAG: DoxX family membrane protein [Anaerolineae bacterium]|nr:DoxX family membrane protein [Anaerolineae bacterium]